jgi:hypothetical protein
LIISNADASSGLLVVAFRDLVFRFEFTGNNFIFEVVSRGGSLPKIALQNHQENALALAARLSD